MTRPPAHSVEQDYARRPAATRRSRQTGNTSRMLLLFVAVVLVGNALLGERGLPALLRANSEIDGLSNLIEALRSENAALRQQARQLRQEPGTIESLARGELGLIRPGEVLVIVAEPPTDDPAAAGSSVP